MELLVHVSPFLSQFILGFKVTAFFLGAGMCLQNELHFADLSGRTNRGLLNINNYGQNVQAQKQHLTVFFFFISPCFLSTFRPFHPLYHYCFFSFIFCFYAFLLSVFLHYLYCATAQYAQGLLFSGCTNRVCRYLIGFLAARGCPVARSLPTQKKRSRT